VSVRVELDGLPGVHLLAERVLEVTWNGWARPIATRPAMEDFLSACHAEAPGEDWGTVTLSPDESRLIVMRQDPEDYDDEFDRAETNTTGDPSYDLTGWVWVRSV